jgi:N-glycosylase/DNA lyase
VEKIKIPVDRRVAAISYTSGLIDVLETKDIVEEIMREKERVIEAWSIVSKICDIPLIRLDSIIWFFGKYVRDRDPVEKALKDLSNMLRDVGNIKIFREFVQQFFIRRL